MTSFSWRLMENWWNAPPWWRERQFHSFLLIKYNLSRQKQEKYYERYLKGMLPITIEGQYYDLGCFCFISCPCTIPVNAIDKAQDWKNDWTFFEGLNLLKAASHAHCLMTFRISTDWACGRHRTAGVCKKLSIQLTASNFSDVGHIPQFSNFKKFQNQPPGF